MSQSTLLKHRRYLACLLFLIGTVAGLHAESVQIGDLYYNLNTTDRTAEVTYENTTSTNYSSLPGDVVIPATVKYRNIDFSVISITNQAFANCKVIQSISIPATVNTIGSATEGKSYKPFYGCTSLKSVKFEDGSQPLKMGIYFDYDGEGMFHDSPLEEVYLGRNIEYINSSNYSFERNPRAYGYSAFYNQPKLTKVTIGPQVTDIPQYLFYKNPALTLMRLPNVKTIGKSAFELCSKLTTLDIGEALEIVGDRAFYGCTNVTKLTFPDAINKIGSEAFYDCTSVTEITVGSGLKEIGEKGFYNCGSFTALILPSGFTTMGDAAFMNCRKLTIAQLGESLTAIPDQAFEECVSLSEMIVPATVQSIGNRAFTLVFITIEQPKLIRNIRV